MRVHLHRAASARRVHGHRNGHWQVQLTTSFGDNRALDPVDMPYTFAYDVEEIITIGVGPDS